MQAAHARSMETRADVARRVPYSARAEGEHEHDHGGVILRRVRDRAMAAHVEDYITRIPPRASRTVPRTATRCAPRIACPSCCSPRSTASAWSARRRSSLLWGALAGRVPRARAVCRRTRTCSRTPTCIAHALLSFAVATRPHAPPAPRPRAQRCTARPRCYGLRGATDEPARLVAPRIDLRAGRDAVWARLPAKTTRRAAQGASRRVAIEAAPDARAFVHVCSGGGAQRSSSPFHGRAFLGCVAAQLRRPRAAAGWRASAARRSPPRSRSSTAT